MKNSRPNILYISSHWPLSHSYGAQMRVLKIGRILKRIGHLSLAIVVQGTSQIAGELWNSTAQEFDLKAVIKTEAANKNGLLHRLRHELDPGYLVTFPYRVSDEDRRKLFKWFREYDLIWVHTIRTANIFQVACWPHSVLDIDDIPSRLYSSSARAEMNSVRRLLDKRMSWIWRRREARLLSRFNVLVTCSAGDRGYLGNSHRIHVIPNGFDTPEAVSVREHSIPQRLGFIGLFHWKPNEQGVTWFIQEVWPYIKREVPEVTLRLIGSGSETFSHLGSDIQGLGWVADPGPEIATWAAMVVPIRMGGGTRIKIAEGFARQCPVVSTSLGAYGYDVTDNEELLLADSAGAFAAACIALLKSSDLRKRLTEKAFVKFRERWTWEAVASRVEAAVHDCLEKGRVSG
jgi:glycosyltransferase involved in cell wall biosynthesis